MVYWLELATSVGNVAGSTLGSLLDRHFMSKVKRESEPSKHQEITQSNLNSQVFVTPTHATLNFIAPWVNQQLSFSTAIKI